MRKLLFVFVAAGATMLNSALRADDYPSRPITLVAVFGPGSASDTICRTIADPLGAALKQSVIVEDRPGADGALAALDVARAVPDGYTLLMATNSPLSAAPFLMKSLNYDVMKDFSPVTRVGSFTLMLVVNPNVPAKSVKELIEYAKANPGKLSFASANTSGIVAGETLKHWAGIDMFHVPYKSSPTLQPACRMSNQERCARWLLLACTAVRSSRNFRHWTRQGLPDSTWIRGPVSSRQPTRRRQS
jgi:tripartite-type tricarboxylate transporter receptor subunit TctC